VVLLSMLAPSTWKKKSWCAFFLSGCEMAFAVVAASSGTSALRSGLGVQRAAGVVAPSGVASGPAHFTGRLPSSNRPSSVRPRRTGSCEPT
jgi:hypothetical protein